MSTGRVVRHDHSPARALNRGADFSEGPQNEFLEDHGFMIETDKIATVIDPQVRLFVPCFLVSHFAFFSFFFFRH